MLQQYSFSLSLVPTHHSFCALLLRTEAPPHFINNIRSSLLLRLRFTQSHLASRLTFFSRFAQSTRLAPQTTRLRLRHLNKPKLRSVSLAHGLLVICSFLWVSLLLVTCDGSCYYSILCFAAQGFFLLVTDQWFTLLVPRPPVLWVVNFGAPLSDTRGSIIRLLPWSVTGRPSGSHLGPLRVFRSFVISCGLPW
jgi:hypothetical protein